MFSQFTEDYVNGVKSFIFSWEEDHHPIHEEALEFYLDPKKFVPRPKPVPAKVPEKEETKEVEQAKLSELKKQEPQPMETKNIFENEFPPPKPLLAKVPEKEETKKVEKSKLSEVKRQVPLPMESKSILENEFPPERNENRALPSQPETRAEGMTHPLERENQKSAISGTPDVHILSFHASKPSVDQVENVFERVYNEELAIPSKIISSADQHINIQDHIMKHKPEYLVLVSDLEYIQDMLLLEYQVQRYKEIVKKSFSVGTKLIFVIPEDKNFREGYLISDVVRNVFTTLNKDIPGSEQLMVMSWNKTPWPAHKDALVRLLCPYRNVRPAPQQYEATRKDPTPSVLYTQPQCVPMKRHFYRASISNGSVVEVLECDPPGWEPRCLNEMLENHGYEKKAIIEILDKGYGQLQCSVHRNEAKLSKIAEGVATNKMHSILVYSYHVEEETNETLSKFIHHVGAHVLCHVPWDPIEPISLISEITCAKPDYVMFSADIDILKDELEVKKFIREHGAKIRGAIESFVGKGVIIMLFGDKSYIKGEELTSKEATQHVTNLTQDIVPADRLTVMTCQDKPYIVHQNWTKKTLNSKSAAQYASDKGYLRYKAIISYSKVTQVLECDPPDWKPDEAILNKVLFENKKEKKALLEIWVNKAGDISSITVATESKIKELKDTFSCYLGYLTSSFSKKKKDEKKSDTEHFA